MVDISSASPIWAAGPLRCTGSCCGRGGTRPRSGRTNGTPGLRFCPASPVAYTLDTSFALLDGRCLRSREETPVLVEIPVVLAARFPEGSVGEAGVLRIHFREVAYQ